MKTKKIILVVLFSIFLFSSCEDEENENNQITGPEIEWISGGTSITYTYSGGVISGYYFYRSFNVLDESGEVTINIQVKDDNSTKVTSSFNAERGVQYSIKVKGSKNGSQVSSPASSCLTVEFSSPNCLSTQEIEVGNYLVSSGGIDTYYCPTSLNFGEISIE